MDVHLNSIILTILTILTIIFGLFFQFSILANESVIQPPCPLFTKQIQNPKNRIHYAKGFKLFSDENNEYVWVYLLSEKRWVSVVKSNHSLNQSKKICPTVDFLLPSMNAALTSTTFLNHFYELQLVEKVVAFANTHYITTPFWKNRVKNKFLKNIREYPSLEEKIAHGIEILLTYRSPVSNGDASSNAKGKYGFVALEINDYLETHPLGRLEWIKLIGALWGKSIEAYKIFEERELSFWKIVKIVQSQSPKKMNKRLLIGEVYEDGWTMPRDTSDFMEYFRLLKVNVLKPLEKSPKKVVKNIFKYKIEEILLLRDQVDFWFHQMIMLSKNDVYKKNPAYKYFMKIPMIHFRVNSEKKFTFYEEGIHRPDQLMQDLAKIFYPDLFANYQTIWLNVL